MLHCLFISVKLLKQRLERFVIVFKILIGTLKMAILAVFCSDPLLSTILSNHFYHFSGCALVTSSRAKGYFQNS